MFGQFPFRDWVLLFICGWIIAHANWPSGRPVRTIVCTLENGQTHQCILDADDPKVAIIQNQIERWDDAVTPTPLMVARWRRELADFYCSSNRRSGDSESPISSSEVAQVAYEASRLPAIDGDTQYWSHVRDKTDQWIAETEMSLEAKYQSRGQAPVKLGPVQMSGVGLAGNLCSILIGFMLATGFCLWALTNPAIELNAEADLVRRSGTAGSVDSADEPIPVAIPAAWIRVNQPIGVKLRRLAFAIIVGLAIAIKLHSVSGI